MRAVKIKPGPDEFGDFQTPVALAAAACRFLGDRGIVPAAVVEPTCGLGSFVLAALDQFPGATCLGIEINPAYVESLRASLAAVGDNGRANVLQQSFFDVDWRETFRGLPEPILVLGNPPWVTNAALGAVGSTNLPKKTNFQGYTGLDALTGKSNFDISEWMLIRLLDLLADRRAWLAILCKTAVARKALLHAWKSGIAVDWAEMRAIDASTHFGAAVDACLFVCALSPGGRSQDCGVYPDFEARTPTSVIGYGDGHLVADVPAYRRGKHLVGNSAVYQWRSGVKHDCSKVMELRREGPNFRNGLGELIELEADFVFPMLKSSELANGNVHAPERWMLVPQQAVGEDTRGIRLRAPKTWQYLIDHMEALDRRGSSIYKNRPRFSVFGVGDYTFAPWKVAISGFYKRLQFNVVGSSDGKPIVLDDTGYFVACRCEDEARYVASLLNSETAREFFSAFIFWDAKRLITVDLLRRLDLRALAREIGSEVELDQLLGKVREPRNRQLDLFDR